MTHPGGSMAGKDLLGGPDPVLLPADPEVDRELAAGASPAELAAHHPAASVAWALLAEQAFDRAERALGDTVEAYAYARTGYHRGLDALRRSGWKGYGPVPWSHGPNRGFLRCLTVLAKAAEAIGEVAEQERCTELLRDCDPSLSA